jgi:hypothetical protein
VYLAKRTPSAAVISASADQSAAAENVPSCNEMAIDFGTRGSLDHAMGVKT